MLNIFNWTTSNQNNNDDDDDDNYIMQMNKYKNKKITQKIKIRRKKENDTYVMWSVKVTMWYCCCW